ncbi:MAG: signal peptidase I [Bacteroidales bacterium]|nr:signal peptidase I [Bacteroidales bacterium]
MVELILYTLILCYPFLLWKTFSDAGYKSWQAFIPVYNYIIWLKIIQKRFYWFILWLIPFINIFMVFQMTVDTALCYGKHRIRDLALAVFFPFIYFPYLQLSDKEHFTPPDKLKIPKKSQSRSWFDSLVWAVVAAFIIRTFMIELYMIPTSSMENSLLVGDYLFVSKMSYGAKTPNTPLSIPFVHNTMPLTQSGKSYVEWIKLPDYRFPGFGKVKRFDDVVFNYPTGDTVILERRADDYYRAVRNIGRDKIWRNYTVISRPIDKEENYVKRCVGIAGDTLLFENQNIYINGILMDDPKGLQYMYKIQTQGGPLSKRQLTALSISSENIAGYYQYGMLALTQETVRKIAALPNVTSVEIAQTPIGVADRDIFPFDTTLFRWNVDNYGPLYIPQAGATIPLTKENMALYHRVIETYEGNTVKIDGDNVWINGEPATTYTFRMNYYWMMGDNRHNSLDSRYWGFVPENHIVGKASFVFLSLDKDKSGFGKIRFNRIFKKAP